MGGAEGQLADPDYLGLLLKTVFYLGIVCALMYVVVRWIAPRLGGLRPAGRKGLAVLDHVSLGRNRSAVILRSLGRYWLVGVADSGVSVLAELEAADVEAAYTTGAAQKPAPEEKR